LHGLLVYQVLKTALQQYRQCTYNVTMRHFHETTVAVEKQKLLQICVCVHARVVMRKYVCACARVALLTQHVKKVIENETLSETISYSTKKLARYYY
jgi:hypothetical protein